MTNYKAGCRCYVLLLTGLLGLVLPSLAGCGSGEEKLDLVPASGVLTYKGKPLSGYQVFFKPEGDLRPANGTTDENGKFVLGTAGDANGALVGKFNVYIILPPEDLEVESGRETQAMVQERKSALPRKFELPTTSGIVIEVPAGGSDTLNIEL